MFRFLYILRINSSPTHYILGQIAGVITTFGVTIYMIKKFSANELNYFNPYIVDYIDCALFAVLSGGIITFIIFSPKLSPDCSVAQINIFIVLINFI